MERQRRGRASHLWASWTHKDLTVTCCSLPQPRLNMMARRARWTIRPHSFLNLNSRIRWRNPRVSEIPRIPAYNSASPELSSMRGWTRFHAAMRWFPNCRVSSWIRSTWFFACGPIGIRGKNNCFRVFLNWVPLHAVRVTMQVSRNTFETFVITLSRTCMVLASSTAAILKYSRSWARYTTRATAARCIVASSALTSRRSLQFPSFSTVVHSGVEILRQFSIPNSRNNEGTCLRSSRTLRPFSPHSSVLPR